MITPIDAGAIGLLIVAMFTVLMQILFIIYLKRKVRINEYLYDLEIMYQNHKYLIKGFLDSGNEVYYQGFPLILINQEIIGEYQAIDVINLDDLRNDEIEVIKLDYLLVNHQKLQDIYAGMIANIQYDCLLNKVLMGGIL